MSRVGWIWSAGWILAALQTVLMAVLSVYRLPPPPQPPTPAAPPSDLMAEMLCPQCIEEEEDAGLTSWERFRSWSKERSIEVHPAMEMHDPGPGRVRGVFAAAAVAPNATLLRVPLAAMFTAPGCLQEGGLAAAALNLWKGTDEVDRSVRALGKTSVGAGEEHWRVRREEWRGDEGKTLDSLLLALCLLEESAKGEESPWAPWIAVLPQGFRGAPLAMPSGELVDCLDGSGTEVREAAKRWRTTCKADYLLLVRELEAMRRFSLDDFHHWRMLVGSRTHGMRVMPSVNQDLKEGTGALVPFADMLNHRHEGYTARWRFDARAQAFLVQAGPSGIPVGQEVTVSYNVGSDEELFLFYGFSDGEADREATLYLDVDVRADPLAYAKREVLMERGLYRGYKLRSAAPLEAKDVAALLAGARVIAAENEEEIAAAAAGEGGVELEGRALAVLSERARDKRRGQGRRPAAQGREAAEPQPACAVFRDRERELFGEVEGFALDALAARGGKARGSATWSFTLSWSGGGVGDVEVPLPVWLRRRVELHAKWYAGQPGGVPAGGR